MGRGQSKVALMKVERVRQPVATENANTFGNCMGGIEVPCGLIVSVSSEVEADAEGRELLLPASESLYPQRRKTLRPGNHLLTSIEHSEQSQA